MALSKEELQRLAELEELDALQKQYGSKPEAPSRLIGAISGVGEALQGGAQGFVDAAPAMGAGAAQGASLGFSDELGATADVGLDLGQQALSGQVPDLLGNKWREYQKSREAANKKLSEESPYAYMGGEFAGGVGAAALTPSMSIIKGLQSAGKLSPAVLAFLEGKAAGAGGRIAGKAAGMAIEGAPLGGAYGWGSSEADINKPAELAMDTLSGAGMGSIGGLAIGGAAALGKEALEAVPKLAKKYDWTRKLGVASDFADKEGVEFSTSEGQSKAAKLLKNEPNEVKQQLLDSRNLLGEQMEQTIKDAEKKNIRINVDPTLESSAQDMFDTFNQDPLLLKTIDPKTKASLLKLSGGAVGDMGVLEARELSKSLKESAKKLAGINSSVASMARNHLGNIRNSLNKELEKKVKGYKEAISAFAKFGENTTDVLLDPNLPADVRTKTLTGIKDKPKAIYEGASDVFGAAHLPGKAALPKRDALNEMISNLKNVEAVSPEVMPILGGNAKQVGNKWGNLADRQAVLGQSQGTSPNEGAKEVIKGTLLGSGQGYTYGLANRYGALKKSLRESTPVKASKAAFTATDDYLMNVAAKLKSSDASKPIGEALEKALQNKDMAAKNAALFKLLQIPGYREMLSDGGNHE